MIAPEIQPPVLLSSNRRESATKSDGWPRRGSACAAAMPFAKTELLVRNSAILVSDSDGAIALTRTSGASSAASDLVNPSTAALAGPIAA